MNKTPSFFITSSIARQYETLLSPYLNECGLCLLPTIASARQLISQLPVFSDTMSPGKLYGVALLRVAMLLVIEKSARVTEESSQLRTLFTEEMSASDMQCINTNHEALVLAMFIENSALQSLHSVLIPESLLSNTQHILSLEQLKAPHPFLPHKTLLDLLREPFLHYPDALDKQLFHIFEKWESLLPADFVSRVAQGHDFLKEEFRPVFSGGPGIIPLPTFSHSADAGEITEESYTTDSEWMPRAVMLAKNCFVWLDQLSKQYNRRITQLDEIPEDELQKMAKRGFNTLWLIGVWERSVASKTIKQRRGNSEAEASAYSLLRYDIASELGGNAALRILAQKAEKHGVRLAGDMVPNHTAIDSDWIYDHPDWFIQRADTPFDYSFTGPDVSRRNNITIQIEDGYWDDSDAAVVFRYHEHDSGRVRYIYHGNDGTTMPWNDTAQLNFTDEAVRYAVKETIFHVTSLFSVIRFDAAMTVTKRHFHRLWFPSPGSGGDIPSRAEYSQTNEEFARSMPYEFWRSVVDEALHRSPETLLLAEAFWLMESYFVRSLGMHRVYNSAFMNFLKDEEGAKFRQAIKSVLEYDPDVLQRYVNFLSNPDEDSTIDQFGDGDKALGATLLLATMPGLPMFAHGQVEGFREKYGMEYRRSYWNEQISWDLVRRHDERIFPLMKRRYLFSGVSQFNLFDMYNSAHNVVHESVVAYINGSGGRRVLVLFNNSSITCDGVLRDSVQKRNKVSDSLVSIPISGELHITKPGGFLLFEDLLSKEWYIRKVDDVVTRGFYWMIGPYEQRCFSSFRQLFPDKHHPWDVLFKKVGLNAFHEPHLLMNALQHPQLEKSIQTLFAKKELDILFDIRVHSFSAKKKKDTKRLIAVTKQELHILYGQSLFSDFMEDTERVLVERRFEAALCLPYLMKHPLFSSIKPLLFNGAISENRLEFLSLLQWLIISEFSWDFVKKLPFSIYFKNSLIENGASETHALLLSRTPEAFLLLEQFVADETTTADELFAHISTQSFLRSRLMINQWKNEEFCNKEALHTLIRGFVVTALIRHISSTEKVEAPSEMLMGIMRIGNEIIIAAEKSEYNIRVIKKLLR